MSHKWDENHVNETDSLTGKFSYPNGKTIFFFFLNLKKELEKVELEYEVSVANKNKKKFFKFEIRGRGGREGRKESVGGDTKEKACCIRIYESLIFILIKFIFHFINF